MQGESPAWSTGPQEQRQHGNWSGEMNPSLSTFSKQHSDHILENLFCPCVPDKETGNFRGKKGPQFLTRWPREVGVTEGAGLALSRPKGATPLFLLSEEVPGSRGKLFFLGKQLKGEA